MLNEAERREFWATFKGSPIFERWKDAETDLSLRFERVVLPAGRSVFAERETADYLYLVGTGSILQSLKHQGVEWLRRRFGPGDYFGQHALFGGQHLSTAVTETEVVLYEMLAGDLRTAMERNSGLYETLLQEKRASRLRSIPLLRTLTDAQVMRIALAMEEFSLDQGAAVPLPDKPGLWLIDFGQITVTSPASFDQPGWRLSAGNFFFSPDVQRAARRAAAEATAYLHSHLFYLPAEHTERLLNAFPDVRTLAAEPLDIAKVLEEAELFTQEGMTEAHRQHLAQFCGWGFVPDRQNITTQGGLGHSFVIIREGLALVTNFDEQGRARPTSYIRPGGSYGETSLLAGQPRDATVRGAIAPAAGAETGLQGADVITLDRRDLQTAFAERGDLWDNKVGLYRRFSQIRGVKRRYSWQGEDELIIWDGRGHPFWLIGPAALPILLAVILLVVIQAVPPPFRSGLLVVWVLLLGFLALAETWFIVNYFDDHYVVTNRRVTRYDRHLLSFSETLMEAPIEVVQDVTVKAGFWGRFFDWGDLTVRTAAKVGAIVFANVPEPEVVKRNILEGKAQAAAVARGQQKEILRRLLISQLRVVLPIPERKRALGDEAPVPGTGLFSRWWQSRSVGVRRPHSLPASQTAWPRRLLRWLTRPLPERLRKALLVSAPPPSQPLSGEIIWRKHPIALIKRTWWSFFGILALLILLPSLGSVASALRAAQTSLILAWLVLLTFFAIVLAWRVADYLNDVYVLTDDKLIDIEMKPFGLDYKRREGNLERVQSVDFKRLGLLSVIFDYGNVVIRTAAADEGYDFVMIGNPRLVQQAVFQKLDALRQRQEAKRAEDRQREMIESLQVYDDIRDMGERGSAGLRF